MKRERFLQVGLLCLLVAFCLAAVLLSGGCAGRYSSVTGLPAGVSQAQAKSWDAAVANLHKIALSTSFVRQGIIDVNGATPLDKEYYGKFLTSIAKVDELQLSASALLRQRPEYFGASEKVTVGKYATDILGELDKLDALGVTGIKNPDSAKRISSLLSDLTAAAKIVLSLTQ